MEDAEFFKICLKDELAKRCDKNPRYSVRAFAKALGLDSGALSRILNGERVPSEKVARKILGRLELTPADQERFLASIADMHRGRGLKRLNPFFRKLHSRPAPRVNELSIDLFRVIGDWYHYALLELTFVEGFESEPRWIASQLGITVAETNLAIERLLNLGLLVRTEDGRLTKSLEQLTTGDKHVTTPALRRHQKQILEKAVQSLENDPIEKRSMTSMTMAIDPELMPIAKQMIEQFTLNLCQLLESGKRKQVYELGVSLYPVQVTKEEEVV
jgi:uncharacterized protein (TIGR02147 family)